MFVVKEKSTDGGRKVIMFILDEPYKSVWYKSLFLGLCKDL